MTTGQQGFSYGQEIQRERQSFRKTNQYNIICFCCLHFFITLKTKVETIPLIVFFKFFYQVTFQTTSGERLERAILQVQR